jgi:hypothetical protein
LLCCEITLYLGRGQDEEKPREEIDMLNHLVNVCLFVGESKKGGLDFK